MHNRLSFWFAMVILGTGCGLIIGYLIAPSPAQRIQFSESKVDFGSLNQFSVGTQQLTLSNNSQLPVGFSVRGECNCTSITPTEGSLAPTQSQVFTVSYRPKFTANRAIAEEKTELRFEFSDRDGTEDVAIPISVRVIKPFAVDSQQLCVAQKELRPTDFSISLSLMDGIKAIEVMQPASFMENVEVTLPTPPFNAVRLTGQIVPRQDSSTTSSEVHLRLFTNEGEQFDAELPITIRLEDSFRLKPDPLRLHSGETADINLELLEPDSFTCKIDEVVHVPEGVEFSLASTKCCQVSMRTTDAAKGSGYLEFVISTMDLDSEETVKIKKHVPVVFSAAVGVPDR